MVQMKMNMQATYKIYFMHAHDVPSSSDARTPN